MKMFIYSMRDFDELPCFEKFCPMYGVEYDYTHETPCLENLDMAAGYDVINIITTVFDKAMIKKLYDLGVKCIATRTIGYDHIDHEYAKSLDMGVVNISYSPGSVADYTIMLMIMGLRRYKYMMQRAAVQDFSLEGKLGRELSGCTVGVIGTGRIGSRVIENLTGFGCRILAYSRHEREEIKPYARYVPLETLYRESDIITLHAPATEETYHMLDEKAFSKMKEGVILINCARGSLIDEEALIEAVESGRIGFAGLDVVEGESGLYYFNKMGEPLENRNLALLNSYPNVVVTPHMAFYTDQAVADMARNSIIGAKKFMEEKK